MVLFCVAPPPMGWLWDESWTLKLWASREAIVHVLVHRIGDSSLVRPGLWGEGVGTEVQVMINHNIESSSEVEPA